jgi:ABC-2 type transport system ATP-binding protein
VGVIEISGLEKRYGDRAAVRGIDLRVEAGEIFGFLGPNGAGKTTTVEILEGYRERTAGEVRVLGVDPARAGAEWRGRIGIVLQESRMMPELTVRETLDLFAGYYLRRRPVAEVLELVDLTGQARQRVGVLSGGQQRRLDVALALIGDPELLFRDEPTTGFDPSARRAAWSVIAGLRALGKTVFLTTHYMDEAQVLADRVAVIARGRIVAEGAPDSLGGRDRADSVVRFRLAPGAAAGALPELGAEVAVAVGEDGMVVVRTRAPVPVLHRLTGWALERGQELTGLEVSHPSLEDVYLELTSAADDEEDEEG